MNDLDKLLAIESIKGLKAQYLRLMDTKQWQEWQRLFTEDAVMDMRAANGNTGPLPAPLPGDANVFRGQAAILDYVRTALDPAIAVHHGHMPEIQLLSETRAQGVWAIEYLTRWPESSPVRSIHGYGHYHDEYVRSGDRWLISSIRLTTLSVAFS